MGKNKVSKNVGTLCGLKANHLAVLPLAKTAEDIGFWKSKKPDKFVMQFLSGQGKFSSSLRIGKSLSVK